MNRFSLSQVCRTLKRKNDITSCITTCYVVMSCGGRNIIFNTRLDIIYFGRCLLMREPNQDVFLLQYWPF